MKFCPECGTKLMEGAKFCLECGFKIMTIEQSDTNKKNEEKEKFENSEIFIKNVLKSIPQESSGYKISISPKISDKVLVNSSNAIGKGIDPMIVVGLIDTTFFKSGKEGVLFTGDRMFAKSYLGDEIVIDFSNIDRCEYHEEESFEKNNSLRIHKNLTVQLKDGDYVHITNARFGDSLPYKCIEEILSGIKTRVKKIETTEQLLQLKDMGAHCISLYLKIIINFLKEDDEIIDAREYKEFISLMARLRISKELSDELREYRLQEGVIATENLVEAIKCEIPAGSIETIFQSLFYDILMTDKENVEAWKDNLLIKKYQRLLSITDSQVDFFVRKCLHDEKIIREKVDDNSIKEAVNELLAVGGATGVSLGALALTGGISTGIWGGLTTIAFASTGGMVLGLAAIGGLSYGAYKGVKYLTGTNELEKYGIRNCILQEKIKEMQLSQSYLIDDINWTTDKIQELVEKKDKILENHEQLLRYVKITCSLDDSSKLIYQDEQQKKVAILLAKIPEILDFEKYDELIKQIPNQKIFNELIFSFYKLDNENKYRFEETEDLDCLEKIEGILKYIGYFDTKKSAIAKTNVMAKKGIENLKGFLK